MMTQLYCRRREGNRILCEECSKLEEYAHKRLSACKYGEQKTSFKTYPIKSYSFQQRQSYSMLVI